MIRIFAGLAVFSLLLLFLNLYLGLTGGDFNGTVAQVIERGKPLSDELRRLRQQSPRPQQQIAELEGRLRVLSDELRPIQERTTAHILVGVAASLVALLVGSIAVTYFIGTSRWCKEVVDTYGFDPALAERSTILKRQTYPWAITGMVAIIALAALGAASNPGMGGRDTSLWVLPHHIGAWVVTFYLAYAYYRQWLGISANYRVIEEILAQVEQVRAARGLDEAQP